MKRIATKLMAIASIRMETTTMYVGSVNLIKMFIPV